MKNDDKGLMNFKKMTHQNSRGNFVVRVGCRAYGHNWCVSYTANMDRKNAQKS